jgi:hypothetical protein
MHGLTSKEIQELRSQAQTPWLGAGITNLKFQALLKEAKKKKGIKEKETKKVKSESPNSFSDENSVKVFGSSVVGQAFGIEAFKKAEKFLTLLSSKGRLKCRTQWCRACSLYKLELSKGVVGHVMKISFPNVIKLTEILNFSWNWERPDSEWAKSHGKANEAFKRLVATKSKPVWYVTIQSEENIMRLLGAPPKKDSNKIVKEMKSPSQGSMRYFAKLGANNEAINIYRFIRGETAMIEDRWDIRSKSWVDNPDADVVRYLTQGEGEFQEITEDVARKIFPKVFEK